MCLIISKPTLKWHIHNPLPATKLNYNNINCEGQKITVIHHYTIKLHIRSELNSLESILYSVFSSKRKYIYIIITHDEIQNFLSSDLIRRYVTYTTKLHTSDDK